jgi:Na+/H+ antiporter NhaD/arsenite permease-like protein/Tfp pilus assembly protein PilF
MVSASCAHRSLEVAVPSFKGFSGARNRLIYAAFVLAALACVSLTPAAGQSGRWERCRAAKPDASIAACSAIIARGQHEKKSSRIDAYIYRASAYRLKGDLDLAIADLNNALRLSPNMPRALKARAEVYAAKGDLNQAITDYTTAVAAQPNSAEAYHGRAIAYLGEGELDKALADFSETIKLDPASVSLRLERAATYEAKGNLDAAIADYDDAIKRNPKLTEAYNRRGLAFSGKGEFDRATADYSAALALEPASPAVLLNRAKARREQHDLARTREDLEAALRLDPHLASAKSALDDVEKLMAGAAAAKTQAPDHGNHPWPLALPFAGMLLSIALGPVVVREWWHIHYEKAAAFWACLTLAGLVVADGLSATAAEFVHTMALEYLPFILMLFALYTAAGGIKVEGKLKGTPLSNTGLLATGTLIASIIGTTGASMILIRPFLAANAARKRNGHAVVFFIFLVSNIGGVLTPLGDPPLFLGFLNGIDFFWPARALWPQALFAAGTLLAIFFLLDSVFYRREKILLPAGTGAMNLRVSGLANLALIGIAIFAIVVSGFWRPGIGFDLFGTRIELQNLLRELVMIFVGLASLRVTNLASRAANGFDWEPIREVAYLFAGIFICIIPAMAMLHAGAGGPFAAAIGTLTAADGRPNDPAYFWATGVLSSFLDNAPTYLVFFELAGGNPATLMETHSKMLVAISLGAVFMGASTYIGNAPNFMVYAIARRAGVNAPSFFSYMLWSSAVLLPLFAAVTILFLA